VSTIAALLRSGPFLGRPVIVLIAHIPIVIITVALLPALFFGFALFPARYAEALSLSIGRLQAWSCAVIVAMSHGTSGTPSKTHSATAEASHAA